jgi:pyridoxamine 5'-phosphate oxidase family protein
MSFSDEEVAYLRSQQLARLATVAPDGQPDVVPVGFEFDGTHLYVGGLDPGRTRKFRNVRAGNTKVALVIDDLASVRPWSPRYLRIYGTAELVERRGQFRPGPYMRITPTVSWSFNLDGRSFTHVPSVTSTRSWPTGRSSPQVGTTRAAGCHGLMRRPWPGSTMRRRSTPVNEVRSACRRNVTRTCSPGESGTRAKPASWVTGRVTWATGSSRLRHSRPRHPGPDRRRSRQSTSSHRGRHTSPGAGFTPSRHAAQVGTPVVWPTSIRCPSGSRM